MPNQLENEAGVRRAVRQYRTSEVNGQSLDSSATALVEATSGLSLRNLDTWERILRQEIETRYETDVPGSWFRKHVRERPVSWLDLCSSSGFRRENALRNIAAGVPNAFAYSLVLRRLNDWVPEVRAAAREQLLAISLRTAPEHVGQGLLSTLSNWQSWGRLDDTDRKAVVDLMSIEQVGISLKLRLISATFGPSAAVLAQFGRTPWIDQSLFEIAATAIQPSVRAKAYRFLLERRAVWAVGRRWLWTDIRWCKGRFEPVLAERPVSTAHSFSECMQAASVDRSPLVRRVAAELLIKHLESTDIVAHDLAELFASDPYPVVAERGRFALAQLRQKLVGLPLNA